MKQSQYFVGIAVVAVIILGVSYYCGAQTGRWGAFTGITESQNLLKQLPLQIGDWTAEKDLELDKASIAELHIQNSYIHRIYKNARTQASVYLTIMVGPTGRVTVHTPEICFGGRDYTKDAERTSVVFPSTMGGADDAFWQVGFTNDAIGGAGSSRISFYYAISVGKEWAAEQNPRDVFRKYRYAYKIQAQAQAGGDTDNVKEFLQDCLPTIHQHLRGAS